MTERFTHNSHDFGRAYERKPYHKEVIFSHSEVMYRGIIKNISLGGAQIEAGDANKFYRGDIITVCIPFTSGDKNVRRKGRIVRCDDHGFAIEFLHGSHL